MDSPAVPAAAQAPAPLNPLISGDPHFDQLPISHRILLHPPLLRSVQETAEILSQARGVVSNDLIGKTQTCFAVAVTAFETGLNPFFLAQGAFQTPEGKVGFDTRRIQAVVESKNLFSKAPKAEYSGPWDNLIGKHEKKKSQYKTKDGKDKWYTDKTWTPQDAKGCKLKITYYFKDRDEPEVFEMDLAEVGTFFSTSWATEPKNQFYNLVFRRGLNQKRASALAGTPAYEDLLAEGPPMREVNERPKKEGNAGLDGFAGETVVNDEDADDGAAASEAATTSTPDVAPDPQTTPDQQQASQDEGLSLWCSADEPQRAMAKLSNAAFVLRNLINDASTGAIAQEIFDKNMSLLGQLPADAADGIEKALKRKLDEGNAGTGNQDESSAGPESTKTVWLSPDDPAHRYTGEGNAIHLIRTGIREAKTAAAAKAIRDQNADLIAAMPERIGTEMEFEVSKRFEQGNQGGNKLI